MALFFFDSKFIDSKIINTIIENFTYVFIFDCFSNLYYYTSVGYLTSRQSRVYFLIHASTGIFTNVHGLNFFIIFVMPCGHKVFVNFI